MNLFQIVTLPLITLLFLRAVVKLLRGAQPRGILLISIFVWLAAGIAILQPDLTISIAVLLGIGRGADLVLYVLTISYLMSLWYLYNRFRKLDSQITEIVRHMAIRDAQEPDQLTKPASRDEAK